LAFSIKKRPRLKRRGFLLVVTSTGLPAIFLQSSALKIAQTKKRSSKLGVFLIVLFIRDLDRITCGFPAKLRFENQKPVLKNSSELDFTYGFSIYS
jgi:hypothetical protein